MGQVGGDSAAAAPIVVAQADAQKPNTADQLHSQLELRGAHPPKLDSGNFTLTGLDGLSGKKGTPPADSHLPPVTISHPGDQNGAATPGGKPKPPEANANDDQEATYWKVGREGVVIGGGLARSTVYGLASLPSRAPELGASVAIGASLSTLAKGSEFGAAATILVGAYFTSKFIVNVLNDNERWERCGDAIADTWHSNKNTMRNLKEVSETGGNFAFDTATSYGAGYLGYKNKALADFLLQVLRLPVPVVTPGIPPKMPLSPQLMGASMYLSIAPAPILYRHHYTSFEEQLRNEKEKAEHK